MAELGPRAGLLGRKGRKGLLGLQGRLGLPGLPVLIGPLPPPLAAAAVHTRAPGAVFWHPTPAPAAWPATLAPLAPRAAPRPPLTRPLRAQGMVGMIGTVKGVALLVARVVFGRRGRSVCVDRRGGAIVVWPRRCCCHNARAARPYQMCAGTTRCWACPRPVRCASARGPACRRCPRGSRRGGEGIGTEPETCIMIGRATVVN